MSPCPWTFDDGGQATSGMRSANRVNNAEVRAIAIACQIPYAQVYKDLSVLTREWLSGGRRIPNSAWDQTRKGRIPKQIYEPYLMNMGWEWTSTVFHEGGKRTGYLRIDNEELPAGRLIVKTRYSLSAVIDHVLHEVHNLNRAGPQTVYGYYREP